MSNPTRSASTGITSATAKGKLAGKRPQYEAPTILTYSGDQFMREMNPAPSSQGSATRHA